MDYRILEIIKLIEEMISANESPRTTELIEELMFEGFQQDEIEEAITWIETYQDQKNKNAPPVFSGSFKEVTIAPDAYAYLLKKVERNKEDEEYLEIILSYCLIFGDGVVTLEKILMFEKIFRQEKRTWSKEAIANLNAYLNKKDC